MKLEVIGKRHTRRESDGIKHYARGEVFEGKESELKSFPGRLRHFDGKPVGEPNPDEGTGRAKNNGRPAAQKKKAEPKQKVTTDG